MNIPMNYPNGHILSIISCFESKWLNTLLKLRFFWFSSSGWWPLASGQWTGKKTDWNGTIQTRLFSKQKKIYFIDDHLFLFRSKIAQLRFESLNECFEALGFTLHIVQNVIWYCIMRMLFVCIQLEIKYLMLSFSDELMVILFLLTALFRAHVRFWISKMFKQPFRMNQRAQFK